MMKACAYVLPLLGMMFHLVGNEVVRISSLVVVISSEHIPNAFTAMGMRHDCSIVREGAGTVLCPIKHLNYR